MKTQESKSYKIWIKKAERTMQKSLWKKELVLGIIGLFIEACFIPCISGDFNKNNDLYEMNETFLFSEPILQEKEKYLTIDIKEATTYLIRPGMPLLPVFTKTYIFTFKTKILEIECNPLEINQETILQKIQPSPEPIPLLDVEEKVNSELTSDLSDDTLPFYNITDLYPDTWYDYRISSGLDNSTHVTFLTVKFYPLRYSPINDNIRYVLKVDFKIKYQLPVESVDFSDIYRDLIIITPSEFSSYLKDFVNYKNNNSIRTKLVILEEIPLNGVDSQESIKYYIKNAVEKWNIRFVLLIGNATKFPVRYHWIPTEDYEINFPSDLYYADIYKGNGEFASWDYNKNKKYGEFPYDNNEVDLYPDVYFGRLPCNDIQELTNVINKIYFYKDTNVWNNAILCVGVIFLGDDEGIDEGEYLQQRISENLTFVNFTRLWVPGGIPDAGDKLLTTQSIIEEINTNKFDIVDFTGHGWYDSWGTHPHGIRDEWIEFLSSNTSSLINTNKLPIVIVGGCFCSKFTEDDNCLGWSLVNQQKGGAVASFGSSGISYGMSGRRVLDFFNFLIFNITIKLFHQKSLGFCWGETLNDFLDFINSDDSTYNDYYYYKTAAEFILFGDPTLNKGEIENYQPTKPSQPSGESKGKTGRGYSFITSSTDPKGDQCTSVGLG